MWMEKFVRSHHRMCSMAFHKSFDWSAKKWNAYARLIIMDIRYLHFYSKHTGFGDILHRIFCEYKKQASQS